MNYLLSYEVINVRVLGKGNIWSNIKSLTRESLNGEAQELLENCYKGQGLGVSNVVWVSITRLES